MARKKPRANDGDAPRPQDEAGGGPRAADEDAGRSRPHGEAGEADDVEDRLAADLADAFPEDDGQPWTTEYDTEDHGEGWQDDFEGEWEGDWAGYPAADQTSLVLIVVEIFRERMRQFLVLGAVAVVVAYLLTLLIPPTFSASASLIIDPVLSRQQEEGTTERYDILSVPTVESLVNQRSTIARIKEVIAVAARAGGEPLEAVDRAQAAARPLAERIYDALPEADRRVLAGLGAREFAERPVEKMANLLEASRTIEKKLAFDVVYSPVIYMDAFATSPDLARAIANTWVTASAEVFQELTSRQLRLNRDTVSQTYADQRERWERTLGDMQTLRVESQLPVLEARYDELVLSYRASQAQLTEAEQKLAIDRAKFEDMTRQLAASSDASGTWLGRVTAEDLARDGEAGDSDHDAISEDAGAAEGGSKATHLALRREAVSSRHKLVESARALEAFERALPVEALEAQRVEAANGLNQMARRLRQLEIEVPALEQSLKDAEAAVAGTKRTMMLRKGPGDAAAGAAEPASSQEEIVNPEWSRMAADVWRLRLSLMRLAPEREQQRLAVAAAEKTIAGLAATLAERRLRLRLLTAAHANVEKQNQDLFDRFMQMKLDAYELGQGISQGEVEVEQLRNRLDDLRRRADDDLKIIQGTTSRLEVLETSALAAKESTEQLQLRLQTLELQLSENLREVKIASLAISPEEKVFPPRIALSLLAAILVCAAFLAKLLLERLAPAA